MSIQMDDWRVKPSEVRPWFSVGASVKEAPNSEEAIRIAKLDWLVEPKEVFCEGREIPNVKANVRSDTGRVLGLVSDRYQLQQNTESFAFVDQIMEKLSSRGATYEHAGALRGGKKTFLLVRLPETKLAGDVTENFMFFLNSHDGSSSLRIGLTNVRVWCQNQMQLVVKGAKRVWNGRHTATLNERVKEASKAIGLSVDYLDSLPELVNGMIEKKVNMYGFVEDLFPLALDAPTATKEAVWDKRSRLIQLAKNTDDLQNFRGTAYGAYQTVSNYVSHKRPEEREGWQDKRMERFIEGEPLLLKAQELLLSA